MLVGLTFLFDRYYKVLQEKFQMKIKVSWYTNTQFKIYIFIRKGIKNVTIIILPVALQDRGGN